jgi:ankyrin repeat protein
VGALERTLYKELAAVIERACKRGGKEAKEKEAKGKERRAAALMMAACYGDEKKIEETLALGADVNVRSGQGYTPLMIASVFNTAAAVKFLIRRGANLETRYVHGRTALHFAALSYRSDPKIVSALAEAGANVNAIDSDGYTPLMLAAYDIIMKQDEEMPKDHTKEEFISYADCETGEVAQILVSAGADIGVKRNSGKGAGEDAMSIALDRKYFRVVRVLLAAGAKLRAWAEKSSETLGGGEVLSETAAILQRHGLKV